MKRIILYEYLDHILNISIVIEYLQLKISKQNTQKPSFEDYRTIITSRNYLLDIENSIKLDDEILYNLYEFHKAPLLYAKIVLDSLPDSKNHNILLINKFDEKKDLKITLASGTLPDVLGAIVYLEEKNPIYCRITFDSVSATLISTAYYMIQLYNRMLWFLCDKCDILNSDIRPLLKKMNIDILTREYSENYEGYTTIKHIEKQVNFSIPKELNTSKSKDLFNKAIEAGLITDEASFYKWNYSKSLLAYFIDKLSYHLDIIPSNNNTPWRYFKPLFNIDKNDNSLLIAKNEYKNKGNGLPQNSYLVDNLF